MDTWRHVVDGRPDVEPHRCVGRVLGRDVVLAELGGHGIAQPERQHPEPLGRLIRPGGEVTPEGHWSAAAVVASALRSVFNRSDATVLLDRLDQQPGQPYWRNVLAYCGACNLQAVLDEYLHHLASSEARPTTDAALLHIAELARNAIALRPSSYEAFDWRRPDKPIPMASRFALRYAGQGKPTTVSGRPRCARPSTARSGHSSWPRPALDRRASTSTDGATRWFIGTRQ